MVFLRALLKTFVITQLNCHRTNPTSRVMAFFLSLSTLSVFLRDRRRPPSLDAFPIYRLRGPNFIMIESSHDLFLFFHFDPVQLIFLLRQVLCRLGLQCALNLILDSLISHILILWVCLNFWQLLTHEISGNCSWWGVGYGCVYLCLELRPLELILVAWVFVWCWNLN